MLPRWKPKEVTICVDSWFTLFRAAGGLSKDDLVCKIYREEAKLPRFDDSGAPFTDKALLERIDYARRSVNRFLDTDIVRDDTTLWHLINNIVIWGFRGHPAKTNSGDAQRVRSRFMGDPSLYEIARDLFEILVLLRRQGVRVVIGSNAKTENLMHFLLHHGIASFFDESYYTSEMLGAYKPFPRFWQEIDRRERRAGHKRRIMVQLGNSLNADSGIIQIGGDRGYAIIMDRDGQYTHEDGSIRMDRVVANADLTDRFLPAIREGKLVLVRSYFHLWQALQQMGLLPETPYYL